MIAIEICAIALAAVLQAGDMSLTVASGDVTSDSAIVWTRADAAGPIRLELAADAEFSAIVKSADLAADEAGDLTVKHEITGLTPATQYWFRFVAGDGSGRQSRVGRFKTAPLPDSPAAFRFVFSGDSDASFAPLYIFGFAAAEQPDFGLWDGDTIYADIPAGDLGVVSDLPGYRAKYRQMYSDPQVQEFLAAAPVWVSWDDHEVANDYDGGDLEPWYTREQQLAGYRAFFEYMPIRDQAVAGEEFRTYRNFRYGLWAEFFILDPRQYRSADAGRACLAAGAPLLEFALGGDTSACREAIEDPDRTFLGRAQMDWLKESLRASRAKWKFVVNGSPMTPFLGLYPYDRWDGYEADRRELVEFIDAERIQNVVVLSADFHMSAYIPDLTWQFRVDRSYKLDNRVRIYEAIAGPIAAETFGSAIDAAANGLLPPPFGPFLEDVVIDTLTASLVTSEGFAFIESGKFSYLVADIDEAGGLTLTYRGYDSEETRPQEAATFFQVSPEPSPAAFSPPCILPALFPLMLLPAVLSRRRTGRWTAARRPLTL